MMLFWLGGSSALAGTSAGQAGETGSGIGARAHAEVFTAVFAGEGLRLTAYFIDGTIHIVFSDGREITLPQAISASGARYTDGDTVFWNKGNEAFVEWDGASYTVRVVDAAMDMWERARRSGVDFRGIGQEPGWLLEIRHEESIHVALDYGMTVITTPVTEFHVDYATGTRTFKSAPPLSPLHVTVTVTERVCYDTMSGEGFTAAVTIELGGAGKVYSGCGRDL